MSYSFHVFAYIEQVFTALLVVFKALLMIDLYDPVFEWKKSIQRELSPFPISMYLVKLAVLLWSRMAEGRLFLASPFPCQVPPVSRDIFVMDEFMSVSCEQANTEMH